MVWSYLNNFYEGFGSSDTSRPPRAPGERYSEGFDLHWFQPTIDAYSLGVEGDGRTHFRLTEPMAGVVVFTRGSDGILKLTADLPNGVTVELAYEDVPEENALGITISSGVGGDPFLIDKCYRLRISSGETTLSEGRWQFRDGSFRDYRFSAGLFFQGSTLRVYAHAGRITDILTPVYHAERENSPTTGNSPNRGPFGNGVSIFADAPGDDVQGEIEIRCLADGAGNILVKGLYSHPFPLEETLPLIPSALSITDREQSGVAWGRHPAEMAICPVGWRLSPLESDGHPEWANCPVGAFAGASRLFRGGREAALVADSSHRSNVSPDDAVNVRLTTLRASWTWPGGMTTGVRDLGLLFDAWNENRMESWGSQIGSFTIDDVGDVEVNAAFLAVNVHRFDATNLGSITDQADAIEITRLRLTWAAAVRYRYGDDMTDTGYRTAWRSIVLSTADAATLLSGGAVTISNFDTGVDMGYLQGTFPDESRAHIIGTFTIQAIGS